MQKRAIRFRQNRIALFSTRSIKPLKNLHASLNSQRSAVQCDIVVLGVAPFHIRVESMVSRAAFILLPETLFGGSFPLPVLLHDTLRAKREIRVDEHPQAIRLVAEDVIRTPPHDHTRPFFRQIGDDLILDRPQVIGIVRLRRAVRKRGGNETARRVFSRVLDIILVKTALLRDLLHQLAVISGDSQLFRCFFANRPSAASKLAADGDDSVFHATFLLLHRFTVPAARTLRSA